MITGCIVGIGYDIINHLPALRRALRSRACYLEFTKRHRWSIYISNS